MYCHECNSEIKNVTLCKCGYQYCCHDCHMKDHFHKHFCGHSNTFDNFVIKVTPDIPDNGVFSKRSFKAGNILFTEKSITQDGW